MRVKGLLLAGIGFCGALYADSFMESSSLKPKQSATLSSLDKKIQDLKKGTNNPNIGFFVDARTGNVVGSSSASLPKREIKKSINTKTPTAHPKSEVKKKSGVEYDMMVEKIELMQGY